MDLGGSFFSSVRQSGSLVHSLYIPVPFSIGTIFLFNRNYLNCPLVTKPRFIDILNREEAAFPMNSYPK